MSYNILRHRDHPGGLTDPGLLPPSARTWPATAGRCCAAFQPDMEAFSGVVTTLCRRVTFDPARSHSTDTTQMVDAGLGPHRPAYRERQHAPAPDIVTFFARPPPSRVADHHLRRARGLGPVRRCP